jgi:ATP-binding cassette, subfamily B (MDR/TAP), member 1
MQLKYEEASQVATDAVGSIRTVASFCAEKKVMEAYEKISESPIRQGVREGVVSGLGFGFSFLAFYFTYALCFYVGAKFVQQGTATFPEVFRVRTYSYPFCIYLVIFRVWLTIQRLSGVLRTSFGN